MNLTRKIKIACTLLSTLLTNSALAYTESFDTYATNSAIIGQGGWRGWDNNNALNGTVVNTVSVSNPNSLRATDQTNVVRSFTGITSGRWVFRVKQFIPSSSIGESDFVLFNRYVPNDHPSSDWSVELAADTFSNTVRNLQNGDVLPLTKDTWVEIRCEIDLDLNHVTVFYGGALLTDSSWTTGGILAIGAMQVFAFDPTSLAYYDDISLEPAGSQDVIAPIAEQIVRGQAIGGTLASWAADDGDARLLKKFLVLNQSEAFARVNLQFAIQVSSPLALQLSTKARMPDTGVFRISIRLLNVNTGQFEEVLPETAIGSTYATFTGTATGDLTRFIGAANVVTAQLLVRQAGPSTAQAPRVSFETALLTVSH